MRVIAALAMAALVLGGCGADGILGGSRPTPAASPARQASSAPPTSPAPPPGPRLTLNGLFHPSAPVQAEPGRVRTLIATGDLIPARLVNIEATRRGDFAWPFRPTAEHVRNADVTYVNLESPLLPGCPPRPTGVVFCGDTRFTGGLTAIGADVANLANNHVYAGPDTERTASLLQQNGIRATTNLGAPVILDVRGLKFAFVGCNATTGGPPVDRAALQAVIQHARQQADVVVVQFHWGKEYERQPLPAPGVAPDDPVELGHLAVDAGADLVIGNHPHWVQGVEIYKDHLVTYAHGNYVFDQVNCFPSIGADYRTYCSDDTRTSVVGTYTFLDRQLVAAAWRPTFIDPSLQTQWADPAWTAQVRRTMEEASVALARRLGQPTG